MDAWLCLLPKKLAHPKSPGDLWPIGLLDPLGEAVLLAIKLRVHPKVEAALRPYPQFAFMPGRSTHHALFRVLRHCREGRSLVSSQRLTLIDKFRGALPAKCRGAIQISLDYAKAFDSMDRGYIRPALLRCGVPEADIAVVEQWHASVHCHVSDSEGHTAVIPTEQGIRQGCPIAPTLWAAYTLLIMDAVRAKFGDKWLQEHLTLFVDDTRCGWLFRDECELSLALAEAAQLLSLLVSMGLRINASKSAALVNLGGTRELWRSTVLTSLEYGITCAGLTKRGLHHFRACIMKQLRHRLLSCAHHSGNEPLYCSAWTWATPTSP